MLIIQMVTEGMRNQSIAEEMMTSTHMVKNWIKGIMNKLGFNNRVEIALWYIRHHEMKED